MTQTLKNTIAANIANAIGELSDREAARKMTQTAAQMGVDADYLPQNIHAWRTGRAAPNHENLLVFSTAFDVSIDALYTRSAKA